ncbi:MAG: response regulator transcription factor [Actinomycetes bacterium]
MLSEVGNGASPPGGSVRVMIVDDRLLFTDALKLLLESAEGYEVVAVAHSSEEAVRYAKGHHPDLAVIGPFMVDPAAWQEYAELIGSVREASPETRVLVLTETRDSRLLTAALDAGALGILEMSAPSEEFLKAARRLMKGEAHLPPGVALELVLRGRGAHSGGLSERDEDLVSEIAMGFTNAEIADHMHLSVRTIESHRARVSNKIGATNRAALVRYALDHGLLH